MWKQPFLQPAQEHQRELQPLRRMRRTIIWLGFILGISLTVPCWAASGPGYHVSATYKIGGDGGWDYLTADASARRLYISRGTHVIVLDLDSGKTVGDIPDTPGVHARAPFGAGPAPLPHFFSSS